MVTTFLKVKNRAFSKLASGIDTDDLSLTVTTGEGSNFPSTYPFHITVEDEIVSCTNRVTDTLTIVRAQQGTVAAAHSSGVVVSLNITAKSISDLNTAVNALETLGPLGASAWVVASDAPTKIKAAATLLQSFGYPVWVCDGTADDVQIQAAIDALPATGGEVKLLDGLYDIRAPLDPVEGLSLTGCGWGTILRVCDEVKSNLNSDAAGGQPNVVVANTSGFSVGMVVNIQDTVAAGEYLTIASITPGAPGTLIMTANLGLAYTVANGAFVISASDIIWNSGVMGVNNYKVRNMTLDGNEANLPTDIKAPAPKDVQRCIIHQYGPIVIGENKVEISGCWFRNYYFNAIVSNYTVWNLHNNYFTTSAVRNVCRAMAVESHCEGSTIQANVVKHSGGGDTTTVGLYFFNGKDITAIGNTFIDCGSIAIVMSNADACTIAANVIIGGATGISGSPSNASITGNTIEDVTTDGIYTNSGSRLTISLNVITNSGSRGIRLYNANNCSVVGNTINKGVYGIWIYGDTGQSQNNVIANNQVVGDPGSPMTYGIWEAVGATNDYNRIMGNSISNATNPLVISGIHTIAYDQHSDLFMDVLAVTANHIVNGQLLVNGAVAIANQPKYARELDVVITEVGGAVSDYTMTIVGVDAKGNTVTEVFTFDPDGLTFECKPLITVTSITLADVADAGSATFNVGIGGKLGLKNPIYETSDVYMITKNYAKQTVAGAQVDTDFNAYDMAAVIGLAATDDFEIWYRSNLNIVS